MKNSPALDSKARDSARHMPAGLLRRLVWQRLDALEHGSLAIEDGDQRRTFGESSVDSISAIVKVHDPRFYRRLIFGGSLGAAEAYIHGLWTCDDLVNLVRIFCRNAELSSGLERGAARMLSPLQLFSHRMRRNTSSGSRSNIAAHYDLGNDFFSLFLDPTLAYSCAIFPTGESTLLEASETKFDHICRKLELKPEDHLLEIGTGWGGFALHAARKYGCRVTTTTISRKQYEFAQNRVREAGLEDRVRVLMEDYRRLRGSYDKLVSIEMIEAVGYQYFDTYFRVCSELLKPQGMMLLQAICHPRSEV